MFEENVTALLQRLKPDDLVLDVGGWACPFNRAQWVLDGEPYETRGYYRNFGGAASQGGDREWFAKDRWVQRDMCEKTPWPFADKQFDFVICSHTLEDLRDPLQVCAEMIRVGKAGYIEIPSRAFESCLGIERAGEAGLSHHRWLIDTGETKIVFLQKYHLIHADWRFALPARYRSRLTPRASVQWLWWTDQFQFSEAHIHGLPAIEAELMRFAQVTCPRPAWYFAADQVWRTGRALPRRIVQKLGSVLKKSK